MLTIPESRIPDALAYCEEQILNPGWDKIAEPFGVQLSDKFPGRLAGIVALSDENFDARKGALRADAKTNDRVQIALERPGSRETFYEGIAMLGCIATQSEVEAEARQAEHPNDPDDARPATFKIITGALLGSNIKRALAAKNAKTPTTGLAYQGCLRPLTPAEEQQVAEFGLSLGEDEHTEVGTLRAIFRWLHPDHELAQKSDFLETYRTPEGPVYVVNAPISPDMPMLADDWSKKVANTADSFHFVAQELGPQALGDRVEIFTNRIYVPFQGTDAHHVLKSVHGVENVSVYGVTPVEGHELLLAAGLPSEFKDPTADNYAQEARSIERSIRRYLMDVEDSSAIIS